MTRRLLRGAFSGSPALLARLRMLRKELRDSRGLLATLCVAIISSVLPRRSDRVVTRALHRLLVPLSAARLDWIARRIESLAIDKGASHAEDSRALAIEHFRMRLELRWIQARSLGLLAVTPETDVVGIEHLSAALKKGHGAILWRMSFTSATPLNAALFTRGYGVSHLSVSNHLRHGRGWISRRLVGPLLTRDEARFLQRRIVMEPDRASRCLIQMRQILTGNGIVSIVGDIDRGRVTTKIPVGKLWFNVPSGAPSLAHASGAALLPCAAVRVGPMSYRLMIFANVAPSRSLDRREYRRQAIERYAGYRTRLMARYLSSDALL